MTETPEATAARAPVVLVHGLFANATCFAFLRRHLLKEGFPVDAYGYRPLGRSVTQIAEGLGRRVEQLLSVADGQRVHLVGHSLGGLIARTYAQLLGGRSRVLSCVTLATPNNGLAIARLGLSGIARDLRPRSALLRRLESCPPTAPVRISSVCGGRDRLVSKEVASCTKGPRDLTVVDGLGHIRVLFSSRTAVAVARELKAAESLHAVGPHTRM